MSGRLSVDDDDGPLIRRRPTSQGSNAGWLIALAGVGSLVVTGVIVACVLLFQGQKGRPGVAGGGGLLGRYRAMLAEYNEMNRARRELVLEISRLSLKFSISAFDDADIKEAKLKAKHDLIDPKRRDLIATLDKMRAAAEVMLAFCEDNPSLEDAFKKGEALKEEIHRHKLDVRNVRRELENDP